MGGDDHTHHAALLTLALQCYCLLPDTNLSVALELVDVKNSTSEHTIDPGDVIYLYAHSLYHVRNIIILWYSLHSGRGGQEG